MRFFEAFLEHRYSHDPPPEFVEICAEVGPIAPPCDCGRAFVCDAIFMNPTDYAECHRLLPERCPSKCTCGGDACGGGHSDWCDKFTS